MVEAALLTVGELARRVGVTVRTIQYYDQEGLLAPSAKGPQNQRLYAEENIAELYRILTLKYLGRSLAQIKAEAAHFSSGEALHHLTDGQMDDIEKSFQQLFKRLTTLRALRDATDDADVIDWEQTAETIESCQDESQFFWRLTCISDASLDEVAQQDKALREESISKWHELIADTIRLMSHHEPLDSERNRGLAQRYLELDESQQALSAEQNFILMENIAHHGHDGSFDELRQTVRDYLETLVVAYRSNAT